MWWCWLTFWIDSYLLRAGTRRYTKIVMHRRCAIRLRIKLINVLQQRRVNFLLCWLIWGVGNCYWIQYRINMCMRFLQELTATLVVDNRGAGCDAVSTTLRQNLIYLCLYMSIYSLYWSPMPSRTRWGISKHFIEPLTRSRDSLRPPWYHEGMNTCGYRHQDNCDREPRGLMYDARRATHYVSRGNIET